MRAAFDAAGLEVVEQEVVPCPFVYKDVDTAVEALSASGPMMSAIRHSGREAVVDALRTFLAPRADPDGTVTMDVSFRYTLRAPPRLVA